MTPATGASALRTRNKTNSAAADAKEERFDWPLCYDAENFILNQIQAFLARNTFVSALSERMRFETGTLLIDWTDYLVLPADVEAALGSAGFTDDPLFEMPTSGQRPFWHPEAMLPRVVLDRSLPSAGHPDALAIHVESISDFMAVHGIATEPEAEPLSRFRRIVASLENGTRFEVVERRAYRGCVSGGPNRTRTEAVLEAQELWKTRRRVFDDDAEGFRETHSLLDRLIALVGRDLACH